MSFITALREVTDQNQLNQFYDFISVRDLLKCFTTPELMRWSHIKELYESELRTGASATGVFESDADEGNKRWEDLRKRVVEHVRDRKSVV